MRPTTPHPNAKAIFKALKKGVRYKVIYDDLNCTWYDIRIIKRKHNMKFNKRVTRSEVNRISKAKGLQKDIAKRFGISPHVVHQVKNGTHYLCKENTAK